MRRVDELLQLPLRRLEIVVALVVSAGELFARGVVERMPRELLEAIRKERAGVRGLIRISGGVEAREPLRRAECGE